MKRTVAVIILLFTLLNISSFFIMKSHAPPYTVFTGSVHYPPDYLYYLSYISQGKDNWLLATNLKSGETQRPEPLNWFYVLGGHIGAIFHIDPVATYQLLVVFASVVYMVSAYYLFSLCFPKQPTARLVAFLLFLLSNAFPKITHTALGWDFNVYYPFNNLGHPFVRLSNVPHHTLIQAFIMASFAFALSYWRQQSKKIPIILFFAGIVFASMQPLQWAFVTGVIGLYGITKAWIQYKSDHVKTGSVLIMPLVPAIALGIGGLPMAIYIKHLYSGPLYEYMMAWENNQQILISFAHFIRLHGPVVLLGMIALPFFLKLTSDTITPLLAYSAISIALFFSPIPRSLGLLNLRFVSVIPIFFASYLCSRAIWELSKHIPGRFRYLGIWIGTVLILAITIPVTYVHLFQNRPHTLPDDINSYLPLGAYQLYQMAPTRIKPNETTLVPPLLAQSFPAFTGRHVFVADAFGTIAYDRKIKESGDFYAGSGSPIGRIQWLKANAISYVMTYAWTPINDIPELEIVKSNDYAILYRVR